MLLAAFSHFLIAQKHKKLVGKTRQGKFLATFVFLISELKTNCKQLK